MSRESELYKDKIEVSLDGRQIFYLFFGGAVIVGLVFVLGVMVGRRVEARGHVERAHVEAAVDPLAALDRLEGGSGLSFPGSLRGGDATSDVEKTIGELAKARQADAKKPAEPKKVEAKPADDKKPEAKPADDKKADDRKADDRKADDKKPEKAAVAKPADDKKADDKKTDDKKAESKQADDKKPEKVAVAKPADDKKPDDKKPEDKKPEDKKPRFTLQLSSFQNKTEAQSFLDGIKSAGFAAYVTEGAVDGKTFYRVRLGTYRTVEAANDAKADFEKSAKKSAQVMRL